jgi:hypothetical protein
MVKKNRRVFTVMALLGHRKLGMPILLLIWRFPKVYLHNILGLHVIIGDNKYSLQSTEIYRSVTNGRSLLVKAVLLLLSRKQFWVVSL